MRISDWSSDVCSSDLTARSDYGMSIKEASFQLGLLGLVQFVPLALLTPVAGWAADRFERRRVAIFSNGIDMLIAATLGWFTWTDGLTLPLLFGLAALPGVARVFSGDRKSTTSELQSLMRRSYAVFCLKKKNIQTQTH